MTGRVHNSIEAMGDFANAKEAGNSEANVS
jgi:hypothetical protein